MPTRRTECNPLCASQFVTIGGGGSTSTSNNGLRLYEIVRTYDYKDEQQKQEEEGFTTTGITPSLQPYKAVLRQSCKEATGVMCMDWCLDSNSGSAYSSSISASTSASSSGGIGKSTEYSVPNVLAFGTQRGEVYLLNWSRPQSQQLQLLSAQTLRRQCSDLAFSSVDPAVLAVGYEKARGEVCASVFHIMDFTAGKTSASYSFGESASSLAWLPGSGSSLAMGAASGWIRIVDTRAYNNSTTSGSTSGSSTTGGVAGTSPVAYAADMNLMAHTDPKNKRVKGMRFDPNNAYILASFSDVSEEPVKIWDLRKVEKSKEPRVLTIDPFAQSYAYPSSNYNKGSSSSSGSGTSTSSTTSTGVGSVVDVEWSQSRADVIAVCTSNQKYVSLFSTTKAANADSVSRTPLQTISAGDTGSIKSICWIKSNRTSSSNNALSGGVDTASSLRNSILITTDVATTQVSVLDDVPLAISTSAPNKVSIAFGGGSTVLVAKSTESSDNQPASSMHIDEIMYSRCKAGYSVDAGKNIQVLYEELDELQEAPPASLHVAVAHAQTQMQQARIRWVTQLSRVWGWVDRVESLAVQDPSLTLETCGVINLLKNYNQVKTEAKLGGTKGSVAQILSNTATQYLADIGCVVYESHSRRAVRAVCGWGNLKITGSATEKRGLDDTAVMLEASIEDLVEEYAKYDTFERACALALWHGDLVLAVSVLRRVMDSFEARSKAPEAVVKPSDDDDEEEEEGEYLGLPSNLIEDYKKLIPLVAMCITGYPKSAPDTSAGADTNAKKPSSSASLSGAAALWCSMCEHVVSQLNQCVHSRGSISYLSAACHFLLCTLKAAYLDVPCTIRHKDVMNNEFIALEDKCAYASTFLPEDELMVYLDNQQNSILKTRDIEGVLFMGLSPSNSNGSGAQNSSNDISFAAKPSSNTSTTSGTSTPVHSGIELLQAYMDATSDVQTVALLVCRLPSVLMCAPQKTYSVETEWLSCYRKVLNAWSLYMERAALDVALGQRMRLIKTLEAAIDTSARKAKGGASSSVGTSSSSSTPSGSGCKAVYPLPEHMSEDNAFVCLKCAYCSVPLPVDPMDKKHAGSPWMRKQRPMMNCCPNCKKPLPRCYVCLYLTSVLNPQTELKVIAKRREIENSAASIITAANAISLGSAGANTATGASSSSATQAATLLAQVCSKAGSVEDIEQNAFSMGKWLMWCQKCKHGGHSDCLNGWFTTHGTCGVNGCMCVCSDTITKR